MSTVSGWLTGLLLLLLPFWFFSLLYGISAAANLNLVRAQRLVRRMEVRAAIRRADGSRGPRARRALRVLARRARRHAVAGPNLTAWVALWRIWLADPDDQVWDLLGESSYNRAFSAAIDPAEPEDIRSAVAAFCAARGLAPQEPSQRALFFVLTGQSAQHRAADPDGTLLAAAYRAARETQRTAVRQALAGADDLDLVRVVAGAGRDAVATVTADEASYLAGQLAGRRDWARLWQFALGLSLADAVTAASRIGDRWQPADDAGQKLLQQLAAADAQQITVTIAGGGPTADMHTTAELLRRPLALLTPADLGTVSALLLTRPSNPLQLLAACLEYRFGAEITLGAQLPITPGNPDDVALSPSPAPQPPAEA